MISEERLAELLKTNSTIYTTYGGYVSKIELVFESDKIEKNHLVELNVNKWGNTHTCYTFDILFETEEEAKEYLKYGNVTRMEKLELPTWKEIQTILNKQEIIEGYFNYVKHFPKPNNLNGERVISIYIAQGKILVDDDDRDETVFAEDFTKENWDKTRDICVKLFKGEEL